MVQIIIVSHGKYANEIISSVEMVCGKEHNLKALTLSESESLDNFINKLNLKIKNSIFNEFLVLVDFLGGTPYNATQNFIMKDNVEVITGVNIPMVLKIVQFNNKTLKELSYIAEEAGKLGIINVSNLINKNL